MTTQSDVDSTPPIPGLRRTQFSMAPERILQLSEPMAAAVSAQLAHADKFEVMAALCHLTGFTIAHFGIVMDCGHPSPGSPLDVLRKAYEFERNARCDA